MMEIAFLRFSNQRLISFSLDTSLVGPLLFVLKEKKGLIVSLMYFNTNNTNKSNNSNNNNNDNNNNINDYDNNNNSNYIRKTRLLKTTTIVITVVFNSFVFLCSLLLFLSMV